DHNGRLSTFQLATASQSRLMPADPRVVNLNIAIERLARSVDHGTPQLVQQHPCGFVSTQPQLPLEEERRDAPLIGRHEIRSPEPDRQGKFGVVKNGPGREGDLVTTAGTAPTSVRPHRVGTWMSTSRTVEPLRPAARRQILLAGVLSGELTLKFAQIRRKWRA